MNLGLAHVRADSLRTCAPGAHTHPVGERGRVTRHLLVVVAVLLLDPTQDLILHRHSGRGRPNFHLAVQAVGNQHVELARWLARRRPGVL